MDKYTQKIKAIKDLQEELDHRKEVEDKVFALLVEGKFEEGKALLDTLDDEKVIELAEGDVAAEEDKKIEINISYTTDLKDGKLKKILERVIEETEECPGIKIRIGKSFKLSPKI